MLGGSTCGRDGSHIETRDVDALGHDYVSVTELEATCVSEGRIKKTCSRCDDVVYETIAMLPHTVVIDKAVAATYETEGKTAGSHCDVCGTVIKAQETIPKLVKDSSAAADATTPASDPANPAQSTDTGTSTVTADSPKITLKKVAVKRTAKKLVLQATLKMNNKALAGKKVTYSVTYNKTTVKKTVKVK